MLSLLVAACTNPRRDEAISTPPASPEAAALALTNELSHHGVHMRGVSAGAAELFWESDYFGEAAPAPRGEQAWIGNTLGYAEINRIADVRRDALGWLLEIEASGGKLRLWLDQRDSALKVKAALLRLRQG